MNHIPNLLLTINLFIFKSKVHDLSILLYAVYSEI